MAGPPPSSTTASNILSTHRALLDTLTSFLTVTTHHILYLRRLYPPISFLSVRAYNYPVRQNRHPAVCTWINDAITAIRDQLEKNTVEQVSLCIYECKRNRVLERWTFDLRSVPAVVKQDRDIPFEPGPQTSSEDGDILNRELNVADLEATFRATLSRISTSAARLRPLPEGPSAPECSFTLSVEIKDHADRPVGRIEKEERKWMAAEPEPFPVASQSNSPANLEEGKEKTVSGSISPKTHAVRRLEAGELRMEVWVEESPAKFEFDVPESQSLSPSATMAAKRAANMSYGAGKEKFDLENGYDLEPADVNRKPHGGAMSDYQRG
ncbi:uncharacterized protein Z518_10869 [Rhinocladiella mackenziei CBS 650.93]|uniref:HORMA domain-containing protein n=1 Tax=Rhinocladiella mackenziei CBS 650.93 TaxID=1442369 RepID=A0A0D2FCY1_9EURO|nr:uncharacterized protein Z518_10869 [Rhinocladiella mackenziei CBS 650.93]KIW99941.1 hypothetical protein Z518_10869 [Rhinocladiella mackenziei CBS 650.93]